MKGELILKKYEFFDENGKLVLTASNTKVDELKKIEEFFGYSISIINYELMKHNYITKGDRKYTVKITKY